MAKFICSVGDYGPVDMRTQVLNHLDYVKEHSNSYKDHTNARVVAVDDSGASVAGPPSPYAGAPLPAPVENEGSPQPYGPPAPSYINENGGVGSQPYGPYTTSGGDVNPVNTPTDGGNYGADTTSRPSTVKAGAGDFKSPAPTGYTGGGSVAGTTTSQPTDTRTPEEKEADFYKALSDATEAAANGNPKPLQDFDAFFGISRPAEEYTSAFYQAKQYNIDTHTYNGIMANFAPVDDNNDGITTEAEFKADGKENAWAQYSSAQRAGGLTKQEWVDLIQRRFAMGMYNPDFSKGPLGQAIDDLAGGVGHNRVWDVSEIEQRLKRRGINLTLAGSPEAADGKISEQELGEFIYRHSQGSSAYLKVDGGVLEKGPGAAQIDARIAAVVDTPPPAAPAPISTSSDVVAYYEALKGFDMTIDKSTGALVDIKNKDGSALTPQQHEDLNDRIQALEGLQLSPEESAELLSKLDAVSGVDITYIDNTNSSSSSQSSAAQNVWDGSVESLHAILTGAVEGQEVTVGADGMVSINDNEQMHINDLLASGFIQVAEDESTRLTDEQIQELAAMFGNAASPDSASAEDTTATLPASGEVVGPENSSVEDGGFSTIEDSAAEIPNGEDGGAQQNAEGSVADEHSSSNTVTTNSDNPTAIEARKTAIQRRLDRIAAQRAPYGGSITDPGTDIVPPPIVGGASNNGLPNQP